MVNAPNSILFCLLIFSLGSLSYFFYLFQAIRKVSKNLKPSPLSEFETILLLLENRMDWFSWIANTSTLLGLLGTVIGIRSSFAEMSLQGKATLDILASGIEGALVTTIAGLCVAIPALTFRKILEDRLGKLEIQIIQQNSNKNDLPK